MSMEPTTASGTSRLGLRASPASWAACSKPSRAKTMPSGMAMNTPLMPNGMNPPPAVKLAVLKTLVMMRTMVRSGTKIFHHVATVLVRAIHLMPSRFSAVNTNMKPIATTRPLPVSRPAGVTSPCQTLASRYPSVASTSIGATAIACR